METAPGESVKIVEMITKHLEFYINLSWYYSTSVWETNSNLKEVLCGQMLSNSTACNREIVWWSQSMWQNLHCCLILENYHSCPNLQQPPYWSVKNISTGKDPQPDSIFCNKKLFKLCTFYRHIAIAHSTEYYSVSIIFIGTRKQKIYLWLTLLWYLLHCGGLELNPQISKICLHFKN